MKELSGSVRQIRRTVRSVAFISRFVVITIAVVLLSAEALYSGSNTVQPNELYFSGVVSNNGTIYFDSYSANDMGNPLGDQNTTLTLTYLSNLTVKSYSITSASNGYENISLGSPVHLNDTRLDVTPPSRALYTGEQSEYFNTAGGGNVSTGVYSISLFRDNTSSPYSGPMVVYFNQSGSASPPNSIHYNQVEYNPEQINALAGNYSGFHVLKVPMTLGNYSYDAANFWVTLYQHKNVLAEATGFVYNNPPGYEKLVSLLSLVGPAGGFLIVVLGLFIADAVYLQDEASGVLSLILSKAVSRNSLLLERYISGAIVLSGSVLGILGISDLAGRHFEATWLSPGMIGSLVFGWLVPGLFFYGLAFVFGKSKNLRRVGLISTFALTIAYSIALWAIAGLYYHSSSVQMPSALKVAYFLSSINYLSLFVNSLYPGLNGFVSPNFVPSDLSASTLIVVAAGVLMSVIPILLFYYLGNRKY